MLEFEGMHSLIIWQTRLIQQNWTVVENLHEEIIGLDPDKVCGGNIVAQTAGLVVVQWQPLISNLLRSRNKKVGEGNCKIGKTANTKNGFST